MQTEPCEDDFLDLSDREWAEQFPLSDTICERCKIHHRVIPLEASMKRFEQIAARRLAEAVDRWVLEEITKSVWRLNL